LRRRNPVRHYGPVKTTTQPCPLCREPADVTDWEPVAPWFAVEQCSCGGFLLWASLWDRRLATVSDMERKDVMARVRAVRRAGAEAWLTTSDGQVNGRLVITTSRPADVVPHARMRVVGENPCPGCSEPIRAGEPCLLFKGQEYHLDCDPRP